MASMTKVVFTKKSFRPDPLERDEKDIVERLHAMADDALARRNQNAVEREAETVSVLLGLRKPSPKSDCTVSQGFDWLAPMAVVQTHDPSVQQRSFLLHELQGDAAL